MKLEFVMITYFLMFFLIGLIKLNMGVSLPASVLTSFLVCLLFLLLVHPPCVIDETSDSPTCVLLYSICITVSFALFFFICLYLSIFEKIEL